MTLAGLPECNQAFLLIASKPLRSCSRTSQCLRSKRRSTPGSVSVYKLRVIDSRVVISRAASATCTDHRGVQRLHEDRVHLLGLQLVVDAHLAQGQPTRWICQAGLPGQRRRICPSGPRDMGAAGEGSAVAGFWNPGGGAMGVLLIGSYRFRCIWDWLVSRLNQCNFLIGAMSSPGNAPGITLVSGCDAAPICNRGFPPLPVEVCRTVTDLLP